MTHISDFIYAVFLAFMPLLATFTFFYYFVLAFCLCRWRALGEHTKKLAYLYFWLACFIAACPFIMFLISWFSVLNKDGKLQHPYITLAIVFSLAAFSVKFTKMAIFWIIDRITIVYRKYFPRQQEPQIQTPVKRRHRREKESHSNKDDDEDDRLFQQQQREHQQLLVKQEELIQQQEQLKQQLQQQLEQLKQQLQQHQVQLKQQVYESEADKND